MSRANDYWKESVIYEARVSSFISSNAWYVWVIFETLDQNISTNFMSPPTFEDHKNSEC